jgi:hypothetical protein
MLLLGHQVVTVTTNVSGTLTLTFDHGHVLEFLDDSSTYESYHIRHGPKTVIV